MGGKRVSVRRDREHERKKKRKLNARNNVSFHGSAVSVYLNFEIRSTISFLTARGETGIKIYKKLGEMYGEGGLDISRVRRWRRLFIVSRMSVDKTEQVTAKIMASVFWDCHGILLIRYMPRENTINSAACCEILQILRHEILRK